jgi:hypothetical protein
MVGVAAGCRVRVSLPLAPLVDVSFDIGARAVRVR